MEPAAGEAAALGPLSEVVRGVEVGAEASEVPVVAVDRGGSDKGGERDKGAATGAPSAGASGRLAPGLVDLSDESLIDALMEEVGGLGAPPHRSGSSGELGQSSGLDPSAEKEFSALMRSVLCPGTGPSASELARLDLMDAAFGQRGVVSDRHLLPEIDNSSLMRLARSHASQNALVVKTLCWRLSLAVGASAQARRVNAELRSRVDASAEYERAMVAAQEGLAGLRKQYQAIVGKGSEMELEIKRLRERLAGCDEACLELARIKSKHAEEVEAVRSQLSERLARLGREAAEERGRLNKMIDELEGASREQKRDIAVRDEKTKWHLGRISQLEGELGAAWREAEEQQSRIGSLKDRIELVRIDKLRAIDEAKELRQRLAWQEEEARRKELESRALQGEIASSRERSAELGGRVAEAERRAAEAERRTAEAEKRAILSQKRTAEAETRFDMLKGELDADCAEAFRIGIEKARMRISAIYPDWDISFLKAEVSEVCPSGEEEDDYEEGSDTESAMIPSVGEVAASEGSPQPAAQDSKVSEKGEPSHIQGGAAAEATEVVPVPDR